MGSQQVRSSKAGRFDHSLKNPVGIDGGRGNGSQGGGSSIGSGLGDALTQAAGVVAVKGFAEAFLEAGLLGVGGDHPTPGQRLQEPLR